MDMVGLEWQSVLLALSGSVVITAIAFIALVVWEQRQR